MADEPSDELSPQQRQVRQLLHAARETAPVPASVVARLDAALAEVTSQAELGGIATEMARGRMTGFRPLLVAAAAVVLLGVGLTQLTGVRPGADLAAGGAADSATTSLPESSLAMPSEPDQSGNGDRYSLNSQGLDFLITEPQPLRSADFVADVTAVQSFAMSKSATAASSSGGPAADFPCAPADWGVGILVPVRYDGAPAVLVLRPVVGDTQVADLVGCGNPDVIRSITLPAP